MEKKILDVTCGDRTIWFQKNEPHTIYCDKRREEWEGDFLSMYVGKNYLQTIDKWAKGYITDREKVISLYLPKVINIFLYVFYITVSICL